jgi:putative membrane protein
VVALGIALALLAALLCGLAYTRWRDNEIAMRQAQPLPHSPVLALLSGALIAVAAVLVGLLLWR